MQGLVSKIANSISDVLGTFSESYAPITNDDKRELYKEYRSFSGFLPYAEWLNDEAMMLLEDHVSVAALWEIEPIRSEGVEDEEILSIEQQIIAATSIVLERAGKDGQYVLSCYTQDEFSLEEEYQRIKSAIHPRWQGTALADAYLKSMRRMLKGMESENGLFKETMKKGADSSDSSMRAYRGGKRRHRIMLYRRVKLRDRRGKAAAREREISELNNLRSTIEATIGEFASIKRMDREGFYQFMTRFLNPRPLCTNGDVNRLIRENPCPPEELAALDGEYALSMLHSKIETKEKEGVIEFDGFPSRFLQIERMNEIPEPGMLTAEKRNKFSGEIGAAFDKLPAGSIFVQHIVFKDRDERRDELTILEKKSRHNDDEAVLTNEQCKQAISQIVKGRSLYIVEMGVYLFAPDMQELDRLTEKTKTILNGTLKLKAISPENNLFPVQSFIRNIPLVYDPFLDSRRKRGRSSWYHQAIRLMPLMGRTRGSISRTNKVCMVNFNRRGEMILFDPLDFDGNAHTTLLGPSGLGKSATLNKTIIELLLFKNARIFIAEAGMSFDPLMDFLETENMDVQRVNIGTDKNSKPVAPFANAKKARDEYVADNRDDEDDSGKGYIGKMVDRLRKSGVSFKDDEAAGGGSRDDAVERIYQSFIASQGKTDAGKDNEEDKKDYMGECVMIAKIMITGGQEKEEAKFSLQDVSFLIRAIVEAANISDIKKENIVRPSHLEEALRYMAEQYKDDNEITYRRLIEMADNISLYTLAVRGKVLNQEAEPFRNCDCLHVELGLAQRESYEDLLALAYLSLMNMINDVAEKKAAMLDDRPIYVITDEAHLILKDKRIAPVAVKIVRMWRKHGAWFLAATQDIVNSFVGESAAILQICEFFIALKPPREDLDELAKLARLSDQDKALVAQARAEKQKYTEAVVINKTREECALIRIIHPSFTLAIAGTEDKEKNEREAFSQQYGVRTSGATMIQAVHLDLKRGLINEAECEREIEMISNNPKYQLAA